MKFLRSLSGSLAFKLTGLFLLLNIATIFVSIVIQETRDQPYRPAAELNDAAQIVMNAYPTEDASGSNGMQPQPFEQAENFKRLNDLINNNPGFWYHLDVGGSVHRNGKVPTFLADQTTPLANERAFDLGAVILSDGCRSVSQQSEYEGRVFLSEYIQCEGKAAGILHIGGLQDGYVVNPVQFADIVAEFQYQATNYFYGYIPLLLLAPFAIFLLVRPIVRASAAASLITPYSDAKTVPEIKLFTEIDGLVKSLNQALLRLDQGYVRERWLRDVIAHELRTPLTVLRGRLERVDDRDLREALAADVRATSRLIDRLLEFSKAIADVNNRTSLSLRTVVRQACADCVPYAEQNGREIELLATQEPDIRIDANEFAVVLILTNLITNAVKHSESDAPVEIDIADDGQILIRDYGAGFDLDKFNAIIDQNGIDGVENIRRDGLGLIIVSELIKFSGGDIQACRENDGAFVFALHFPVTKCSKQT